MNDAPKAIVIGMGHPYRSDDGVGLAIVKALRERTLPGVNVVGFHGDAAGLIEAWSEAPNVVIVDALSSGAQPGTILRVDVAQQTLPAGVFRSSTHVLSIPDAVELARVLERLPKQLILYGIEGETFAVGEELSSAVAAAVLPATDRITAELASWIQ